MSLSTRSIVSILTIDFSIPFCSLLLIDGIAIGSFHSRQRTAGCWTAADISFNSLNVKLYKGTYKRHTSTNQNRVYSGVAEKS